MKRSAVTSLAYLGSSVVVTGGLDGGVLLARKVSTVSTLMEIRMRYPWSPLGLGGSGSRYSWIVVNFVGWRVRELDLSLLAGAGRIFWAYQDVGGPR
jgi:hypothetical protein